MLIYLDSSLRSTVSSLAVTPKHRQAFETIALARREGNHVICGDPSLLDALAHCESLPLATASIYKRVCDELPQARTLTLRLETHIRVASSLANCQIENAIVIELEAFSNIAAIAPTRLLAENLSDCHFYRFLGQAYTGGSLGATVPITCTMIPGGGSQLPDCYAHYKPITGMTLAIADSDRHCPNAKLGDVARRLIYEHNSATGIGDVLTLNAKGIENLFPKTLLDKAIGRGWTPLFGKKDIANFTTEQPDVRFFTDLKNGIRQARVLGYATNSERHSFWSKHYRVLRDKYGDIESNCQDAERCPLPAENCGCWIVRPLGGGALPLIISEMEQLRPRNAWHSLDSDLKREWERIGRAVTTWCCGTSKLFAY